MSGGLIQLAAQGAQDMYLTGDPQITFFKVVYRRHTNFSLESVEQTFSGVPTPGKMSSCVISRHGDLIGNMFLEFNTELAVLPTGGTDATRSDVMSRYYYEQAIEYVELEIGGQKIDKLYGEWMDIWYTLTHDPMAKSKGVFSDQLAGRPHYMPLLFWFNRNVGLSLPLIALQYHEVKLNVLFKQGSSGGAFSTADNAENGGAARAEYKGISQISSCKLWVDFIYLAGAERKRIAEMSHEYLIEQLQHTPPETIPQGSTHIKSTLNFNHPIKELVWVVKDEDGFPTYEHDKIRLSFNGHNRFQERPSEYFTTIQPYYHHTTVMHPGNQFGIHIYSFALRPEEHQPTGTCNFSRIDDARLIIGALNTNNAQTDWTNSASGDWTNGSGKMAIYAVNYNVLRIVSGMGGLAYSN